MMPFVLTALFTIGFFQYQRTMVQEGAIGSSRDDISATPQPVATASATIVPSATPVPTQVSIPRTWSVKRSACGVSFPIPPAEEPYIVPPDPNTPPSFEDDEGKRWVFEEAPSEMFLFTQLSRAIFKDPTVTRATYVSGAVDVYCLPNTQKLTTDGLYRKLDADLTGNYSVVKIRESLDDTQWGIPVKKVRFQGGAFGNEEYYLLASAKYLYMIRVYGESTNPDVISARDMIFATLSFQ